MDPRSRFPPRASVFPVVSFRFFLRLALSLSTVSFSTVCLALVFFGIGQREKNEGNKSAPYFCACILTSFLRMESVDKSDLNAA